VRIGKAVILAAGKGKRLGGLSRYVPKPLVKVLNIPLILYVIAGFLRINVNKFHVVTNRFNYKRISELLSSMDIDVSYSISYFPERGNGYSLLVAMENIDSDCFYLSMSDHIHAPSTYLELYLKSADVESSIALCVDSNPKHTDINEATKVLIQSGKVISVGKNLKSFTHIDVGLFIFEKDIYPLFKEYCKQRYVVNLSDLVNYAIKCDIEVAPIELAGNPWIDVDTVRDLRRAEELARNFIDEVLSVLRLHGLQV